MTYAATDPRSQLATAAVPAGVPRPATYRQLSVDPPDEEHQQGSRTWWTRTQALVVAHTAAQTGDTLNVDDVTGEHVALVLEGAAVDVRHDLGEVSVDEPAVVVIPPGRSAIAIRAPGTIVRLIAVPTAPSLATRCRNAADHDEPDPNVTPFVAWPDPPGGPAVRTYPLAAYPLQPDRFGRIFRCSTVMVNVLPEAAGPRDPSQLSPHSHDDFEQVSLQLRGDYVHHMRVPWTPDATTWRDDEHHHTRAPAVVVIPPPMIHTSQGVGDGQHWLVDVFAPPRRDFSDRPGWVLNADEYPMPKSHEG